MAGLSGWILMSPLGAPSAWANATETAGDLLQFVPVIVGLTLTYTHEPSSDDRDDERTRGTGTGDAESPPPWWHRIVSGRDATGRWQLAEAAAATTAVTLTLKLSVDKKRPNGHSMSFPSGHAATAAFGAAFLQRRYGWRYGVPAYLLTGFVAWSRVDADRHFAEDVIAGAGIGILGSYIFTRPYRGVEITPIASGGRYGVALRTAW